MRNEGWKRVLLTDRLTYWRNGMCNNKIYKPIEKLDNQARTKKWKSLYQSIEPKSISKLHKNLHLYCQSRAKKAFYVVIKRIHTPFWCLFHLQKQLYNLQCPSVCLPICSFAHSFVYLSVSKTPQQRETIILHHSSFILSSFRNF